MPSLFTNRGFPIALLSSSLLWLGCSTSGGGGLLGNGTTNDGTGGDGGLGGDVDINGRAPPGCGDGKLTSDEACDDSNKNSGDGCAANCLSVELGFSCNPPGAACQHIARCGDGVAIAPEQCDDGGKVPGDGCSATCKYEAGYKCDGNPSVCTTTTCGDMVKEGAESCEDGNAMPFDGCSSLCQNEPDCTSGACSSECGDGIALDEACDDGNNTDGDGCSASCTIEAGYECGSPDLQGGSMKVPAVYRDFLTAHGDFEEGATGQLVATKGLVLPDLDAEGKPAFAAAQRTNWTSPETFKQWYRDVPGTNSTTTSFITLWSKGDGSFVNRYWADGRKWQKTSLLSWCGTPADAKLDDTGAAIPCSNKYTTTECETAAAAGLLISCQDNAGTYQGTLLVEEVDGNPLFFPVDGDMFTPASELAEAKISPDYGSDSWLTEGVTTGTVVMHNFSFTSEVRYWFKYDASLSYTLDFMGDDDVWVFINRKLAVDIGGIHATDSGSVTLDASSAAAFGLESGKVYEVELFHAERQKDASTFKLTLSGFSAAASECKPICGDGILGVGEECDDGKNDGGYGECGPGCVLEESCGDGTLQAGEDCDDGNNLDGDRCGSACRNIVPIT